MCLNSPRLKKVDYASFLKEIGAIEIHEMEDYFLYLYDKAISVSNETNSIVAYLIFITDKLPERNIIFKGGTMPDVDTDFTPDGVKVVLKYIQQTYGHDKVSNIGTYGKMYARSGIRFIGRALGVIQEDINRIAKLIPDNVQGGNWTIKDAIEHNSELQQLVNDDFLLTAKKSKLKSETHTISIKTFLGHVEKLEGVLGNRSIHAAGVVISNESLNDMASTWRKDDQRVLEYDGDEAEKIGLVKMDLLSLKTLAIMDDAIKMINKRHDMNLSVDDIPMEDDKVFELMKTGNLLGVFQITGDDISKITASIAPTKFSDVVLILAGYRPGPMQFVMSIDQIRHGRPPTVIQHSKRFPILKELLEETYGYFIFQEQIQRTVEVLAGYSDSEADEFRKVISKKIKSKMPAQKARFYPKALEKGLSQKEVDALWGDMENFSAYAFNKSHAVGYAVTTMQTAYLKAYYPVEFFTANITHELISIDKVVEFVSEAKKFNIKILPPSINESFNDFWAVDDNTIRFGLAGIIGLGEKVSKEFITEREANGVFKSVTDFIVRCKPNSNVVRNLILAGAFDGIVMRSQLFFEYPNGVFYLDKLFDTIKYYKDHQWIFGDCDTELIPLPVTAEYPIRRLIEMEVDVTKLYLSSSPFEVYNAKFLGYKEEHPNATIGILIGFQEFKTKSGFRFSVYNGRDTIPYNFFKEKDKTTSKPIQVELKERKRWKTLVNQMVVIDGTIWRETQVLRSIVLADSVLSIADDYSKIEIKLGLGSEEYVSLLDSLIHTGHRPSIELTSKHFNRII